MENLELAKKYVDILQGKDENKVIGSLKYLDDLTRNEKNLIYTYLFPKPLLHMELPKVILGERGRHSEGFLEKHFDEVLILVRAYRGLQYKKFMQHLLHSFIEDQKKIFVEEAVGEHSCAICKKTLYDFSYWKNLCDKNPAYGEQERKEFLAYGSVQSSLHMCLDCMVQLRALHEILQVLEGPYYLGAGYLKQEKRAPWDPIPLGM